MSDSTRAPCERCGQPMFHLAQVCPHCGARRGGEPAAEPTPAPRREKPPPLSLSPEEARALLSVQAPPPARGASLVDVAKDLVLPRAGALELVTSLVAAPLTLASVAAVTFAALRTRRSHREAALENATLLAVPASAALVGALLYRSDLGPAGWVVLAGSGAAWLVRAVVRARARDLHG